MAVVAPIIAGIAAVGDAVATAAAAIPAALDIGTAAAGAASAADLGLSAGGLAGTAAEIGGATIAGAVDAGGIATAAAGAAGGFTIADALGLTGAAVSAAGQIAGANAQAKAAQFNQQATEAEATQTLLAGQANARQVENNNARAYGAAAAAIAASGIDPTQGTPLEVMADITRQGELSRQLTLYNASNQAQQLRNRAGLFGLQAGQATTAGAIGAGSTLLGAVGRVVGNQPGSPLSVPVVRF